MELYQKEKKGISVFQLTNNMVAWKDIEETKWLKEVNSQALQMSLRNLDNAYTRFFRNKKGFPKFKNKGNRDSFCCPQHSRLEGDKLFVPKFKEGIKTIVHRELSGEIKSATISKTPSGKYFASILTEDGKVESKTKKPKENRTLGIDLGITNYLTDSEGKTVGNPRHLKQKLHSLKRASKKLSRKQKGGKNREKQKKRVAILHEKVANSRKDFLHKLTKKLVENQDYDSIAMEDLAVKDMMERAGNGKKGMNRAIGDCGWGMFRELLTYKSKWYGKNLLFIGRFDPSSKLCSCGYLNQSLTLKDRTWECPECKITHNRDILAAQNIKRFAFCKQNTSSKEISVPQELRKPVCRKANKTLLEFPVRGTLKKEASMALA